MLHHWHAAVDKSQSVRMVFVDFAKAFDHVDHNILVAKFVELGLPDVIVRWMCAFLRDRRQRVKIGDVLSDWLQLAAGMPQGSYLGPLTFVILIDALRPGCLTHKYVDDTTMTEILEKTAVSGMQSFIDELVQQSSAAGMTVNGRKTKEMLVGAVLKDPPPYVTLSDTPVERVASFKLLGVYVASDLKCMAAYRHHHIQSCIAPLLPETTEALRRQPTRPTVFLHHHHTSGAGVRMSGVALKSHGGTVQSAGVDSAESDEDNLR